MTDEATPPTGTNTSPADTPPVAPPASDVFAGDDASPEIPAAIVLATSILCGACIVFAMVLCVIVIRGAMMDHPSELTIRLLMSCIACFVGMAFACLGFGLFLLRARGRFRANVGAETGAPTRPAVLESTAPGLVVIVCATVVIWLALHVHFEETTTMKAPTSSPVPPAAQVESTRVSAEPAALPHVQNGVKAP